MMSLQKQDHISWQKLPVVGLLISELQAWREEQIKPHCSLTRISQDRLELAPYPLHMDWSLELPHGALDGAGIPFNRSVGTYSPAVYHPTTIAHYALGQWNAYLYTHDRKHQDAFMIQARWFVEHEVTFDNGVGAWPIPFGVGEYNAPTKWLSALTQGNVISVLIRAYQLTCDEAFLQTAHRAVRTFELEAGEGSVAVSLGKDGIFFEEVAVNPPAHILNGYILAVFGLYDYVFCTGDTHVDELIKCSLRGLHSLIDKFDMGYWSRYDLLHRTPATLFYHALHVTLLEALAQLSGCQHCAALAAKWDRYQHNNNAQLRYFFVSRTIRYRRALQRRLFHSLCKCTTTITRG